MKSDFAFFVLVIALIGTAVEVVVLAHKFSTPDQVERLSRF